MRKLLIWNPNYYKAPRGSIGILVKVADQPNPVWYYVVEIDSIKYICDVDKVLPVFCI